MLNWGLAFLRNSSPVRFRANLRKNVRLASYSLEVLRRLRGEAELHYDEAANGTMKFYRDPRSLRESEWLTRELAGAGVRCERLDARGVLEREPALEAIAADVVGGLFFPDDESGDAYKYCMDVARLAAGIGVEFRYGVAVEAIRSAGDCVDALVTCSGEIRADHYVLAAGSYSPLLGRTAGVGIPVQPVKGYSLTLDIGGWTRAPRIPLVDDDLHVAATPIAGRLRVAGTAEFAGHDLTVTQHRIRPLLKFVSKLFPRERIDGAQAQYWAGLRPYSCDGVPIVGGTALRNLFLNTGHGHLGWSMAAGSGKLLADLIGGAAGDLAASPYGLERFRRA
jgi:D-amino-acid dehydrogenase